MSSVHHAAVVICSYMLPGSLFSEANLIIYCGVTLETSNSLQAKRQDCNNPQPPSQKPSIRLEKQTAQTAAWDQSHSTSYEIK